MVINDFKQGGLWAERGYEGGQRLLTQSHQRWVSLLARCKPNGKVQQKYPTYMGCTASELFLDFQSFTDWCHDQVGFGLPGYQLDKDILLDGNKEYSENTCVFVPRQLNTFLCDSAKNRSKHGIGVTKTKDGTYTAQVTINGVRTHLGTSKAAENARSAYRMAKQTEANKWVDRITSGVYIVDSRVVDRMKSWKPKLGE